MEISKNKQLTADEAYRSAIEQGYSNPERHPYVKALYASERKAEMARIQKVANETVRRVRVDNMLIDEDEALRELTR